MAAGYELLKSGKRFSNTMWEYSWLVQRSGKQAEYADWDKVLDEVVERGYDCLRIDAYPHLIAADDEGDVADQFEMEPITLNFMWGNHETVTVRPREGLVEFMRKASDRGLYFGLSSWFNNDSTNRKCMVQSPEDLLRVWRETLEFLKSNDLLDRVIWVDLCNEFPWMIWLPGVFQDVFKTREATAKIGLGSVKATRPWSRVTNARFDHYFFDALNELKAEYPELAVTLSFEATMNKNVFARDGGHLEVIAPHIWATDDPWWLLRSGMIKTFSAKDHERNRMRLWGDWARQHGLWLITTEGWANVNYEEISPNGTAGEWDWFKSLNEFAVDLAIEQGWQGICTSNFAQPHFEGMWADNERSA